RFDILFTPGQPALDRLRTHFEFLRRMTVDSGVIPAMPRYDEGPRHLDRCRGPSKGSLAYAAAQSGHRPR
ncbi:hypothetical protein ACWEQH_15405, partial [Streptomyces sp. NPDC004166]